MLIEQLELDFEPETPIDTIGETSRTKVTSNIRLTKAYELARQFRDLPKSRAEQEKLIRIYYHRINGCRSTIPVEEASDEQLLRVAQRLFFNAHYLLINRTPQERRMIQKLFVLDRALRNGGDSKYIEALDDRVCMQLEEYPENSDLVREYDLIKGHYQ